MKQQNIIIEALIESQSIFLASFKIANMIAVAQKPFSKGEIVKQNFLENAKTLFSNNNNLLSH